MNNLSRGGRYSRLKKELMISKIYNIVLTIFCCVLFGILVTNNNNLVNEKFNLLMEAEERYQELETKFQNLQANSEYLAAKYKDMSNTIAELTQSLNILDEENQSLVQSNEEYYQELVKFSEREELFNKYEYAIYNKANKRTDITYEQLTKLEDLVKDTNIKDEDLILSIIMTESTGKEKAQSTISTAKGYGQFLDGTSRFVYTKLLDYDNWNSSVALNGDINIEMMVAYLEYLYEKEGGDIYQIIRDYRGLQDISSYVAQIDSYLKQAEQSKSVQDISKLHPN